MFPQNKHKNVTQTTIYYSLDFNQLFRHAESLDSRRHDKIIHSVSQWWNKSTYCETPTRN